MNLNGKLLAKVLTVLFSSILLNIQVFAEESIVGLPYYLKVNGGTPATSVVVDLFSPASKTSSYQFSGIFDNSKVATVKIPADIMSEVGVYRYDVKYGTPLKVVKSGNINVGGTSVDVNKSFITPDNQVLNSISERAVVTVKLVDLSGQPVSNHYVKLISDEGNAIISAIGNPVTNAKGEASFEVALTKENVVTLTAYDSTADVIINGRAKVAVLNSKIKSSLLKASVLDFEGIGAGVGELDSFEFDDVPTLIRTGNEVSFTVRALDPNGDPVLDYDGTVRFSVVGGNPLGANLPGDYTFVAEDLGEHTFSLGTSFSTPGAYEIEVRDIENTTAFATQRFVVTSNLTNTTTDTTTDNSPVITNPTSGTYSNNVVVITGTANPGSRIKVFDNSVELGIVLAGSNGAFSYTTNQLVDGDHDIYVAEVDTNGTIIRSSGGVRVKIDTDAPKVSNVSLSPSGDISPGERIVVRILVTEKLSRAVLVLQDNFHEMNLVGENIYEANLTAPLTVGEYPISIVLSDELNNESEFQNHFKLTVTASSMVPKVENLKSTAGGGRVSLTWNNVNPTTNKISHYRVYYGNSQTELINAVETFTAANTWYIPNLEPGKTYYFAVVAVDDKGNTSTELSEIVSSTPFENNSNNSSVTTDDKVVEPDVDNGEAGKDAIKDLENDVSNTGPGGFLALVFGSIVLGNIYVRKFGKVRS